MGIVNNASAEFVSGSGGASIDLSGAEVALGPVALATTTDATPTPILEFPIPPGLTVAFEIVVMAKEPATSDSKTDFIQGTIKNDAGTTSLVGAPAVVITDDVGAAAWTVAIVADDTSDELDIVVTGEVAHTIDWKLTAKLTIL